ncbi:S8 family serine peptidase, partial [Patescibacteria group bacterium]|nr:S8 family serine peptidase [Patescibacteria group bacterium]
MPQHTRLRLFPNIILIFITCLLFVLPTAKADEIVTTESGAQVVADEFVIKYKDSASFNDKREHKQVMNLEQERINKDSLKKMDIEQVQLKDETQPESVAEVVEHLENDPSVQYVEPNYIMSIQSVNDPSYEQQWALSKIGIEEVWSETQGASGVVIAVLDTGIDYSHPDRPKNIVAGYDFINDDSNPQDDHGHGTFVSGVIAANTNNSTGIAGICQNCSIMPVKVMDGSGMGTYADVANGIVWSADNGADIINLSIGGYAYSQILQDAVNYAQSKGVLVIAAGGNQGVSSPLYPAAYSNVIGVGATTQDDEKWSRSNYGSYIDISAPGVSIYGLSLGSYRSQTGTSATAPHIAGIAGLLMSKNQALSPNLIVQQLYQNTVDLGIEGKDYSFGYGRIGFGVEEVVIEEEISEEEGGENNESNEDSGQDESENDNIEDDNNSDEDMEESVIPTPTDEAIDLILQGLLTMPFSGPGTTDRNEILNINTFLNSQNGVLKDYKKTEYSKKDNAEYLVTASEAIYSSVETDYVTFYNDLDNSRIVLVVLELVKNVVTDSNFTNEEIDNIFGVTREQYIDHLLNNSFICPPNADGIGCIDPNSIENMVNDTPTFSMQLNYTFDSINTVSDLKNLLHNLADSEQQYKHWMSFEEGSFFSIYDDWFGLPISLMEAQNTESAIVQNTEIIEPPKDDFLKSAYEKLDNCRISAFFDHYSPVYVYENQGEGQKVTIFTGREFNSIPEISGYNYYSGHNGLDAHVRECNPAPGTPTGKIPGKPILVVADGEVSFSGGSATSGYGYYVEIEHYINNADINHDDPNN